MSDLMANTSPLQPREVHENMAPRRETDIHTHSMKERVESEKMFIKNAGRNHRRYTDIHVPAHKPLFHDPVVTTSSDRPVLNNRSYQLSTHFVIGDGKFHGDAEGATAAYSSSESPLRAGRASGLDSMTTNDDTSSVGSRSSTSHVSNVSTPLSRRLLALDRKKNSLQSHFQLI